MAKAIRKGQMKMRSDGDVDFHISLPAEICEQYDNELAKEAGDILWQLSGLCTVMGWNLEDIARQNLEKLASRQARNKIDGNGDNR